MSKLNGILKKSIKKKKKDNSKFTLRFMSKTLNISHTFLSDLLNGNKKWPLDLLDKVVDLLEIDDINKNKISEILMDDLLKDLRKKSKLLRSLNLNSHFNAQQVINKSDYIEKFDEEPPESTSLLNQWYFISLLDLSTCDEFILDFKWIAKRLGITSYEAEFAWNCLVAQKYVELINGRWCKTNQLVRIPTVNFQSRIQNYHRIMLSKALSLLKAKEFPDMEFSDRMITSLSIATNLDKLKVTRNYLEESSYRAAEMLSEGPCNEIYQLCIALFPITIKKSKDFSQK